MRTMMRIVAQRACVLAVSLAAGWTLVACAPPDETPAAEPEHELAAPAVSLDGWSITGSHAASYELAQPSDGVAVLRSRGEVAPKGFGALMQTISAEHYRGRRVRFAADVESVDVEDWAGLWMRVDAAQRGEPLAFDNMANRAIRGSTASARYEVVLDVSHDASAIALGVLLSGTGEARISGLALEVVDASTPLTSGMPRTRSPEPQNLSFEDAADAESWPRGWLASGDAPEDFAMERDTEHSYSGEASARLRPSGEAPRGFGTLMQMVQPGELAGTRVRLRAMVRGEGLDGWAGLWMRTDRADRRALSFDNMQNRPLTGTFEWRAVEVVLDVPAETDTIAFGVLQSGGGTLWIDDVSFETVGDDVPTTTLVPRTLPDAPRNLELRRSQP